MTMFPDPSKIVPLYNEVKKGKKFEITCKGTNLTWSYYGKHTLSGIIHQNEKIYTNNTSEEQQGLYICHGIDKNQEKFFGVSQLSVLSKYLYDELSL